MWLKKFSKLLMRGRLQAEFEQPGGVVGEVDVCSDVLAAWIGVDVGTGEPLMLQVGAQRAVRAAVVELRKVVTVVDAEHGAAFPMRRPVVQPVADAGMQLATLPVFEGTVTQGTEVCRIELMRVKLLRHPDFVPETVVPLHERGGEGIEQFVVIDEGVALSVGESGFEVVMPVNFTAESLLLLFAQHWGSLDNVEGELTALPPAKGLPNSGRERAIARADFDDVTDARLRF